MNKEQWFAKHPNKKKHFEMVPYTWENKVIEEAGEVLQVICKIKRFGLHHKKEGQEYTNKERVLQEIEDLEVAIHEYKRELGETDAK